MEQDLLGDLRLLQKMMEKMDKTAFLFPGQGAQYLGMGKDFFDNFSIAKQIFEEANDLLHLDITKIIFEGSEEDLIKTKNSQVAIFVTSMAILNVLEKNFPQIKKEVCAGLSLGEYSAICAAKKIGFQDVLFLVQKRALFMNDACEKTKGTMAAILGLDSHIVEALINKLNPPNQVWVANYNTPEQTVISGTIEGVEAASTALKEIGAKKIVPLDVHGAFHSGIMKEAQNKLKSQIEHVQFKDSEIDIVMNVTGNYVKSTLEIKKYLIMQVTNSVRWQQSIKAMNDAGINRYIEIGPGKTLTVMNRKNNTSGIRLNIDKISDLEKLEKFS